MLPSGRPLAALTLLRDGKRTVTSFAIKEDQTSIGRDATNNILIASLYTRVSKVHVHIIYRGDGNFYLNDVSRHGTWVDGEHVQGDHQLEDGACIILGGSSSETAGVCTLEFRRDASKLVVLPTAS